MSVYASKAARRAHDHHAFDAEIEDPGALRNQFADGGDKQRRRRRDDDDQHILGLLRIESHESAPRRKRSR